MSRVAVITGGGSGIGRAACEYLARHGHRIAVLDVVQESADEVAATLRAEGAEALGLGVDVIDRGSIEESFAKVRSQLGRVEILVTSAAAAAFVPFEQITVDDWNDMMNVNLTGTFHCAQAAIADMVASGWGRIVTISSAAGQVGSPRQVHYSASKGGVIAFTKALALEYAALGITVNTIPPFTVDTPMLRAAQSARDLPNPEVVAKMIPARRLGTVDDIAATCAFLCSEEAGYITGQVVAVNGGAVL
ncbi:MAG: SDR family NAD(P)-dependent oxidoreductase [Acidimicrobiia bacterium]